MELSSLKNSIVDLLQGSSGNLLLTIALVSVATLLLFSLFIFVMFIRSRGNTRAHAAIADKYAQEIKHLHSQHQQLSDQLSSQLEQANTRLAQLENLPAQLAAREADVAQLNERLSQQQKITHEQQAARHELDHTLNHLKIESSETQARMLAEQKAMEEKLALLQENKQQLSQEFENLANKIFQEKQQSFNQTSKSMLDHSLSPLKNQLESFRKRVDDVYSHEAKERHLLKGEIEKLRAESLRISEDATSLTKALRADNKTQGDWGELKLSMALEACGLTEPNEFETQPSYASDGSTRLDSRPDVVVHLPGGRDIVIDSKVSLLAYSDYFRTDDEIERELALKQHVDSIKAHIKGLSAKSYQNLTGINTLDYVMMYIPIEGASAMALQSDPTLWEEAYSRNIVLVSPTNLLAILRSVETIWRHEKQNKNAERIAAEAGKLHDQFVLFAESLSEVGRQIDKAHAAYEKANDRLLSGRGNVVRRIENLEKLGAKTQRKIPDALREKAEGRAELDLPLETAADEQEQTQQTNLLEET